MIKRTSYEFTLPFNDEMDRAEITALYCLIRDLLEDNAGCEFRVNESDKANEGSIEITVSTVDCP